ncbi:MAG: DUF2393 family protein [Campylobacterota bacterium]|nr:DUF2393 family protein [Campylobacterota bacterium]
MKFNITKFIDNLITYDYILFGSVFVIFIIFIILAIILRKKLGLAIFLVLIAFSTLLIGPTIGYIQLHKYLFKNTITMTSQKKLEFTQALIVNGTLTNESKFNFEQCKIKASIYKITTNEYKNYLMKFKPFKKMSIYEEDIKIGETINFKMIVEPFTYSKKYDISLKGDCK